MAKDIIFSENARQKMMEGIEKLTKAVSSTLGPKGRHIVLEKKFGSPLVTNDGVSIAKEIEFENKFENLGAKLVSEVASKTNDVAGDGTTTATVLAHAMIQSGMRNLTAGANPVLLRKGIERATAVVLEDLKKLSKPISEKSAISQVAAISSGDNSVGELIADAMEKVGNDGVITIEESKGFATELDVVEGMQFDRGYLSPYMVTDPEKMIAELENPYILITDNKLSNVQELVPLLEKVLKTSRPLVLIAEDVEQEVTATLVVNKLRGAVQAIAVKAPGFGDRRKYMLEDIAVLTGGTVITKDLSLDIKETTLEQLGQAARVIITKSDTTIVEGSGDKTILEGRISQLKSQIQESTSDFDKEKLEERLAKLAGGVAVIKVGAATEAELKEKKLRIEDALNSTRAAVEEGIVPGGGVTLIHAIKKVAELTADNEDEKTGIKIVMEALESPIRKIATNAGFDGSVISNKVKSMNGTEGFDVMSAEYKDLVEAGIIDPTKVVRSALQNASSIAGLFLTIEGAVVDIEKPESAAPGGMPGMGGGMPGGMGF